MDFLRRRNVRLLLSVIVVLVAAVDLVLNISGHSGSAVWDIIFLIVMVLWLAALRPSSSIDKR